MEVSTEERWTSAVFCITSLTRCVDSISETLGVQPSRGYAKGEPYSKRYPNASIRQEHFWLLESALSDQGTVEAHIEYFLNFFTDKSNALLALQNDCEFCIRGSFSSLNGQGGFTLDHSVLKRLVEHPVDLGINLYPPEEKAVNSEGGEQRLEGLKEDWWTSAAFCIASLTRCVDSISETLGVQPSRGYAKGEPYSKRYPNASIRQEHFWLLESALSEQNTLEAQIESFLTLFADKADGLLALQNDCECCIMSAYSLLNGRGGFTVDHSVLKRLVEYPVDLSINLYPPSEKASSASN